MTEDKNKTPDTFVPLPAVESGTSVARFATTDEVIRQAEELKLQKEDFQRHKQVLNWTFGFVAAVLVVCVVAFITFLLDSWHLHAVAYKEFQDQLKLSRAQSETLQKELQKSHH